MRDLDDVNRAFLESRNGDAPAGTTPQEDFDDLRRELAAEREAVQSEGDFHVDDDRSAEQVDIRKPEGRTEASNAKRLVQRFGRSMRYCGAWNKWLDYTGKVWSVDTLCRTEAKAKLIADQVWQDAIDASKEVERGEVFELLRFAKATSSANGITNMVKLARSEQGMAVSPDQLDSHPYLFNAQNGTIELKTGKLLPHDRNHLITKISPVKYVEGAEGECPIWELSVDKIFRSDKALVRHAQKLFGMALIGEVIEHILPIPYGGGSNGKTIVMETVLDILGEYGDKASPDLLLVKDGNAHPTEKADLFGKRLVFATETDSGRRLSEATVKELTGGDTIHARRMREDFWSFKPSHTVMLVTNHKPRVLGTDHGIWRRLQLIPFEATFWNRDKGETGPAELEADKGLKAKLQGEYSGILRWLVQGCLAYQKEGLGEPEAVKAATRSYRTEQDVVGTFIAEQCAEGPALKARAKDIYAKYVEWCEESGEHAMNQTRFGSILADKGFQKVTSNGVWYTGIGVCSSE